MTNAMLQYILVSLLVLAAIVYIVIQLFKKKKGAACGQSGCEGCPLMDKCTEKG
jgi:hypothetical protein